MFAALVLAVAAAADPLHAPDPVLDAGEVRVGPPLVRRFAFANAGREPLTVTDVRSSCGCLAPTLAKRTYEPGQRGELGVEVNTLSQPVGPHRWAFTLAYRCGAATGERTFELAATLKQEIEVTPAAVAFRGDGPLAAVVAVRDPRPKPLTVTGATASAPFLRVTASNDGPGRWAVRVEAAGDCPEGRHAETVTITTDDPDYPALKLPVTVVREPRRRVAALPNRAALVAGGSALVQLRADGEPVRVEAAEGNVPALACRWAAGPGDRATVRVGLDRAKWDGKPFTGEVRVRLAAPAGEVVVIPVAVRSEE
ncbi:MAG TPA: DUF1573 domain-containing protein [Gemmataceae bacterium]|jgi:hypothetical protein